MKFKNTTHKSISLVLNGKKVNIRPNEIIEGPEHLNKYTGLIAISEQLNLIKKKKPFFLPISNRSKIPDIEITIEDIDATIDIKNKLKLELINITPPPITHKVNPPMKKIDLKDFTFNIPISIESEDRKNNLTILLNYIDKYFDTNVLICESSKQMVIKNFWEPHWSSFCKLFFLENKTDFFYKTRLLNELAFKSTTPYLISYDSDVLMHPEQYTMAANAIRSKKWDFCYPFNMPLKHILKHDLHIIKDTLDLNSLDILEKPVIIHPGIPPGGTFFINKEKFIEGGMENENMIAWGPEDQERLDRLSKLGYKIGKLDGYLYHMDHEITKNSFYTNPLFQNNVKEHQKVLKMPTDQLKEYIKTWRHK